MSADATPRVAHLSVPPRVVTPDRRLTDAEVHTLHVVADALIPSRGDDPSATQAKDYDNWLRKAIAARAEHFDDLVAAIDAVSGVEPSEMFDRLRVMHDEQPGAFQLLSAVVAGAYLMVPEVRGLIGYPGQVRHAPDLEGAVDQIADGILDPVMERGSIYVVPSDS